MKEEDILDENSKRTKGYDALSSNISAAKIVSSLVKSTLGPMGMDKMLVDNLGNTVVTNDGFKILRTMDIGHPAAKLVVEVAKTQEKEVGDGTTSAVILTGALLEEAENLLKQNIHPNLIVRGFKKSSQKALEIVEDLAISFSEKNKEILTSISKTAISGKMAELGTKNISNILVECSLNCFNFEDLKIVKASGGNIEESFFVSGVVLDKNFANSNEVEEQKNPKILIFDIPLEVKELEADAKVNLNSFKDYDEFLEENSKYLTNLAKEIKKTGATCVISQKGIDDTLTYELSKEKILTIRRVRKSDIEKISKALNSKIISNISDLNSKYLGVGKLLERKKIGDENYIFLHTEKKSKSVSLILRASTNVILDELERACEDSFFDLQLALKSKKIVAGGGACELEISKRIKEYGEMLKGKESLIVKSYARSFESIPKTLMDNCGLNTFEILPELKKLHKEKFLRAGLNGFLGVSKDTLKNNIIEPINIKLQAIKSSLEASCMILRIDDVIAAEKIEGKCEIDLD